jgi:hypothetical protein
MSMMLGYDIESLKPVVEGMFGPELTVDIGSGDGSLRFPNGAVLGEMPQGPATNGFLIWLGYPIVVLSAGITHANLTVVAARLRVLLNAPRIPVVANLGALSGGCGSRIIVDEEVRHPRRDLARAEAYALVQGGLLEGPRIIVELEDESFEFLVTFEPRDGGLWRPIIE